MQLLEMIRTFEYSSSGVFDSGFAHHYDKSRYSVVLWRYVGKPNLTRTTKQRTKTKC